MGMVIADAKPVVICMKCDVCGEGMMEPVTDSFGCMTVLATNPPLYNHRCSKCGTEKEFHKRYPDINFMWNDGDFREMAAREREAVGS